VLALGLGSAMAQERRPVNEAFTANELEAALEEAGLSPTMLKDKETGDPVATGTLPGGLVFVARAMDCEGSPRACAQVVLFANFDVGRPLSGDDFRVVNAFNEGNVNGRAYVLEDRSQVGVDYVIDLTGGVTDEHVASRLTRWPAVVGDFREEMVAAQTGS
jgi:hypothetical protein